MYLHIYTLHLHYTYFSFYNPARKFSLKKNFFRYMQNCVYPEVSQSYLFYLYPVTRRQNYVMLYLVYNIYTYRGIRFRIYKYMYTFKFFHMYVYTIGTIFVFLYHIKLKQFFPNFYTSNQFIFRMYRCAQTRNNKKRQFTYTSGLTK